MDSFFGNGFFDETSEKCNFQFPPPSQSLGEVISSQGLGSYVYPQQSVDQDNRISKKAIQLYNNNNDDELVLITPGISSSWTNKYDELTCYHCNFQAVPEGYGFEAYAAEYFAELYEKDGKFTLKYLHKLGSDEPLSDSCEICRNSNGICHPADFFQMVQTIQNRPAARCFKLCKIDLVLSLIRKCFCM